MGWPDPGFSRDWPWGVVFFTRGGGDTRVTRDTLDTLDTGVTGGTVGGAR